MNIFFQLKYISDYRAELMGWSILWIMMLHFTFTQIKPLGFIAQYGFAGVDIFMFVSGFGIYFSLEKNNQLRKYYKKRLLRIFPTYYILGIIASLFLYKDNFWQYLFRYSTIGFWTGGLYAEWYIPAIVVLYAFAPFIKKIIDRHKFAVIGFICFLFIIVSYLIVSNEFVDKGNAHFFFTYRIPEFILGMICAFLLKNNMPCNILLIILLLGVPIFALLFRHHHEVYNYKYFSLLFLIPLFIVCFTTIAKVCKFINPIVSRLGAASLETYIIQGMFYHAILTKSINIPNNLHDVYSICLILLSSLLGLLSHWLINKIRIDKLF